MNEEDPYLVLLNFRAYPGPDGTPAPATKLMNRPIRTRLPRIKEETSHQEKVLEKQLKQKQYYDIKTKPLHPLAEGSTVRMHSHHGSESLAQVIKKAETPRSYIVQTESGRHLKK